MSSLRNGRAGAWANQFRAIGVLLAANCPLGGDWSTFRVPPQWPLICVTSQRVGARSQFSACGKLVDTRGELPGQLHHDRMVIRERFPRTVYE